MTDAPQPAPRPLIAMLQEAETPLGLLQLRRRWSIALERQVYEILLNNELMMSSAVYDSEYALAQRGLAETAGERLRVLVGGLGLGFTAQRVLQDPRVGCVVVVERLPEIIAWHREGVLPWAAELLADRRLDIRQGDFFNDAHWLADREPAFDAMLIDIDDAPHIHWRADHAGFYTSGGLRSVVRRLRPGGVFALWAAVEPQPDFLAATENCLAEVRVVSILFENPSLHQQEENFLVLGRRPLDGAVAERESW